MALIVFLRGVNVGGHKTFRPSILARELRDYSVVNVGAAGTFIVRKPGPRAKFRAELLRKLPFEAQLVLCDGRDPVRLETKNPFATEPSRSDIVRFVSILSRPGRGPAQIPFALSITRGMVGTSYRVGQAIRLREVPSPHEDDRLSRPDR